jgi:hypothetical protein
MTHSNLRSFLLRVVSADLGPGGVISHPQPEGAEVRQQLVFAVAIQVRDHQAIGIDAADLTPGAAKFLNICGRRLRRRCQENEKYASKNNNDPNFH